MSALAEKVAREHHLVYVPEVMARHCSCGQRPGPYVGGQWHPYHVAQVAEAATRAALEAALDVDELAAVLSRHWNDMVTGESLGRQRHLAHAVIAHLTKGNENDE